MIKVETYKMEEMGYPSPEGGIKFVQERVQTGGWGVQIKSSKDVFQVDEDDDEDDYPDKKSFSDEIREKLR